MVEMADTVDLQIKRQEELTDKIIEFYKTKFEYEVTNYKQSRGFWKFFEL